MTRETIINIIEGKSNLTDLIGEEYKIAKKFLLYFISKSRNKLITKKRKGQHKEDLQKAVNLVYHSDFENFNLKNPKYAIN